MHVPHIRRALLVAALLAATPAAAHALPSHPPSPASASGAAAAADVAGTVSDSTSGRALQGAAVTLAQGGRIVFSTATDAFGHYVAHNITPGAYTLSARYTGFGAASRPVTVGASGTLREDFRLAPQAIALQGIQVTATVPIAVDTRSGDQRFQGEQFHGSPATTTSQILQQSIAGAARAPTGEVHIRGQHAEYTYYVDGVPVPAGISGSLNELFDPTVVDQIDFKTGGWDAEYGNKNAAIVNVTTRIPAGGAHAQASAYAGSFDTNGQSLSLSDNVGRLGLFLSGSRQESGMRREPIVFDTARGRPVNFHNHGQDLSAFGKLQYTPGAADVVDLDASWSGTRFQVPYDSTGGVTADDRQRDVNAFVNLGWRHQTGGGAAVAGESRGESFAGAFYRHGSLGYTPGVGDAQFVFFPDTLTPYTLRENRRFDTWGTKLDYAFRPRHGVELKAGTLLQLTRGREDFETLTQAGAPGPASNSPLSGHDYGVYAQTALSPTERFEVRAGVRYDAHAAPFAGTQHQVSPRVRLNFYPDAANTLYLYYGRLFVPTNVEDLRAITSVAQGGVAAQPTLPERDHFYEAGYVHRFPFGVVAKLSAYHKDSAPGIDDNTVPGSAIVTSVNLAAVHTTGLETVIEVRPRGPFSGYANAALSHAWGHGPITGGFFPAETPDGNFDLDHDQRLSAVLSGTWSPSRLFVSATGTYGSGLTNGVDPDPDTYDTGLFAFNRDIKVDPSFVLDASAGYTLTVGGRVVQPQLYVNNVFDKRYLLKGAFFSGASVGRPRSVQLRLNVGL
ncbi:MAG: hypothetical protein JWM27_3353 [Gemmatimonadetes bacterium]|nr:hypothetical protein [Gemmatimonadota bacterium]